MAVRTGTSRGLKFKSTSLHHSLALCGHYEESPRNVACARQFSPPWTQEWPREPNRQSTFPFMRHVAQMAIKPVSFLTPKLFEVANRMNPARASHLRRNDNRWQRELEAC